MSRRFVILFHTLPAASERANHWDFMLEFGDSLRTWALAQEPHCKSVVAANVLPDHRLAYLQYEGPISQNRGHVRRIESGRYSILKQTHEVLAIRLSGAELHCNVEIVSLDPTSARFEFGENE